MRTLLIDNYDSFTYNIVHTLAMVTDEPTTTMRNDDVEAFSRLDLTTVGRIVISPGPGHPGRERDFGLSRWALEQEEIPVLGVCLGHQGLCLLAGARVDRAPEPFHGRSSAVRHRGDPLLAGIPSPFEAIRYHSLAVDDLPPDVAPLAWTEDGILMAVRHRRRRQWGVQFHPESIGTEVGARLFSNFVALTGGATRPATAAPAGPPPRSLTGGLAPSGYTVHVRPLASVPDLDVAHERLFGGDEASAWLDSSRVIPGFSRWSIVASPGGPLGELLTYRLGGDGEPSELTVTTADGYRARSSEPLFHHLARTLDERRVEPGASPADFALGYVGYVGYEVKADTGGDRAHRSEHPDAVLLFCDRAVLVDHEQDEAYLLALTTPTERRSLRWLDEAEACLTAAATASASPDPGAAEVDPPGPAPVVVPRHDDDAYRTLIESCQEAIAAGESYEICLTNRFRVPVAVDPSEVYRRLRRANPAPYAALLRLPGFAVLSSSPERFMKIDPAGRINAKPIKGTSRRGTTTEEDLHLRDVLAHDVKERAENIMIVDLLRNDIGRGAVLGSVRVPLLFDVETYETVHQLVSTIVGDLDEGVNPVVAVANAFPGGSMTGAPKLRTMEIIDELEAGPRGVYSGALGYVSLSGATDLSIVIRTMVVTDDEITIGTGGAITALSDPAAEIDEVHLKARALLGVLAATPTRTAEAVVGG